MGMKLAAALVIAASLGGCASVSELQTRAMGYPTSWLCVASVGGGSPTERGVWRAEVDRRGQSCEPYAAEMQIEASRQAAYHAANMRLLQANQNPNPTAPLAGALSQRPIYTAPAASPAPAGGLAVWTGRSRPTFTVAGAVGVDCEYNFMGRSFGRVFAGSACPPTIEVQ